MQQSILDFETKPISIQVRDENFKNMQPEIDNDRERVYNAVKQLGPITLKELAMHWGCSPNDISGRFTELKNNGRIIAVGKKLLPNHKGQLRSNTLWM